MTEERPRILHFKESLPTPACMALSLFFALVFQLNGGVFLPTAVQMSSSLGWIREDIMMAAYASFIGMTIIFPILFRLKFRFMTRHILLTVCPVLITCNLITMHTSNLAILVMTCFISGFFRMWGTFECFSNIRLSVTPSGNFSVFYPLIYIIVLESIQLSGLISTYISDMANWQYMHWLVIGLLIIVWTCIYFLTRPIRAYRKKPLYGIDWTGAVLWTIFLFTIVYICIYGEFYDWLDSMEIRAAIVIAVMALMLNINRMTSLRRPYIELQVFRYKNFPVILFLFLMLCFYLTSSSVLETLFMSSILQYDTLNAISLNWFVFAGILTGAGIVFYRQVVQRKGFKLLIFAGFFLLVTYEYYMYFLIYPGLNIESLYLPDYLRGIGHGILYIALTIYVAKSVPFQHFFQGLCILSFVRTSIATPLGTGILNRCMRHLQQDKLSVLTQNMDQLRLWSPDTPVKKLYAEVLMQTTMTSLRELFGWICITGTILLIIIICYRLWRKEITHGFRRLYINVTRFKPKFS